MSKNPPGRSDAFRATGRGGAAPRAAVGRLLERQGGPDGVLGGGQPAEKIWENYGKIWEFFLEYQAKRWDDLVVLGFAQLRNLLVACWLVFFPSMTPKMQIFSPAQVMD